MGDKEKIKEVYLKCWKCKKIIVVEVLDEMGENDVHEFLCPRCSSIVRLYTSPKKST